MENCMTKGCRRDDSGRCRDEPAAGCEASLLQSHQVQQQSGSNQGQGVNLTHYFSEEYLKLEHRALCCALHPTESHCPILEQEVL
ncbi:Protein of unknown function, partial [Gryllus bimaculatus]